jgi:tetratricopeptide (TPR) repeat protein
LAFERRSLLTFLGSLFLFPMLMGILPFAAVGQEVSRGKERAEALAGEALQLWDRNAFHQAMEKFRESLALDPKGGTYRDLGNLYSERDMHEEAIAAYRSAIAADPSLEPELLRSLGEQLLWADRHREAVPVLALAVAGRPHDIEAKRHLALAYRLDDRPKEAEDLYREILRGDPSDADARKGLAASLLWQGRFRAASTEFEHVLAMQPSDADVLSGLSRARLFLDLPEEAAAYAGRAAASAPADREVREQVDRVRERLSRHLAFEARGSNDSDKLTIVDLTLSAHARPHRGLDLDVAARQLFFRQGSPGKSDNLNNEDSVDGSGGSLSLSYRGSAALEWRFGAGLTRYDIAAGFHPWTGHFGITLSPADTVRFTLDWERSHFDSILSLQNKVTADTVNLSVSKHFLWKTEITASGALIYHHNENGTGQGRDNRGERFGIELTRRLYLRGDIAHIGGIVRVGWLGFSRDLDVGVFDPRRYTTEEAGLDGRWRFRPLWEFHGILTGGLQQESGQSGGPMYSAELGLDRKIGVGRVSFGGFATDSNARGRGEGFRRYGGLLSFLIPF